MLRKTLASLAVGGIMVGGTVGLVGVGAASAATPAPTATTATSKTAGHPFRAWLKAHRKEIRQAFVTTSAKAIGVTPQQLVSELRSGKSVAQVAGEHNVSVQTVVGALVQAADAKINQAVADHQLTSAQGSKLESLVPGWATKAVNHTF